MKNINKKFLIITLAIVSGLMASFVFHAFIEMIYINWSLKNNLPVEGGYFAGFGWCALPDFVKYSLPILGALIGLFIARAVKFKKKND